MGFYMLGGNWALEHINGNMGIGSAGVDKSGGMFGICVC